MRICSSKSQLSYMPNVSMYVPDGIPPDLMQFENCQEFIENTAMRNFAIQGELLKYYVVMSFADLKNKLDNPTARLTELFEQIHSRFEKLNFSASFMKHAMDDKNLIKLATKSSVIGHMPVSIGSEPLSLNHHPYSDQIKKNSVSKPPRCFEDGTLVYELEMLIGLDEKDVDSSLVLHVEAALGTMEDVYESPRAVEGVASEKIVQMMQSGGEKSNHVISVNLPLKLQSPFKLENLSTSHSISVHNIELKPVLETAVDDGQQVSDRLIHNSKLMFGELPMTLLPLESHSVLLNISNAPIKSVTSSVESVDHDDILCLKSVSFVILLTWSTPSVAYHIKSKISILLPIASPKNGLLVNFKLSPTRITPGTPFQIAVRVTNTTNLKHIIHICIPSESLNSHQKFKTDSSDDNAGERSKITGFLLSERRLNLGLINPQSESSGCLHGLAFNSDALALHAIKIIHIGRDGNIVNSKVLDWPLELFGSCLTAFF